MPAHPAKALPSSLQMLAIARVMTVRWASIRNALAACSGTLNPYTPSETGWRAPASIRYTGPFMSYASIPSTARAAALQGMGMMPPALARAYGEKRALGARMITTITPAAT